MLSESNVYFKINNENSMVKELKSFLNIAIVDEQAKTIEISYEYHNARLCYDMVSELLNEYLQWERDSKQDKVNKTIEFIDNQIDSLSNILRLSKDSLNDYRRQSRILNPETMGIELSDNISELNESLLSLDEELFTLDMISEKVNKNPNRLEIYRLIPEMVGKKSFETSLVNQIEKLNKLLEKKDDLLREVTNENVQIMIINEKIKNSISISIKVWMSLKKEYRMTIILSTKLKNWKMNISTFPRKKWNMND